MAWLRVCAVLAVLLLGERVALFCQRKSANEVEIEIVSKGTLSLNISGADWTTKIFASLERQLRP